MYIYIKYVQFILLSMVSRLVVRFFCEYSNSLQIYITFLKCNPRNPTLTPNDIKKVYLTAGV